METPAHALGAATAASLLSGLLGEPVVVRHLCPACGSDQHGRPWVRLADGSRPHISVAHAGAMTLVGVSASAAIGVDIEPADATAPPGIEHPDDVLADDALGRVDLWVRKEAFLKATGDGLRRDPASVGPHEPGAIWTPIDAGRDYRAVFCVLDEPPAPRAGKAGNATWSSHAANSEATSTSV